MKIKLKAIIFVCMLSCSLVMTKDSYGFQIVSQVGADSTTGESALTAIGQNLPEGPGWVASNIAWIHTYDASIIKTINFATLEIDLIDPDTGFLRMINGGNIIADFDPPVATQNNGLPGPWRTSQHPFANNTTFTIDLPTFGPALLSGTFTITGLSNNLLVWGTNRAILTIDVDPIPEPATIALLGIGLAGLSGGAARRKWKKKAIDKGQVIIY